MKNLFKKLACLLFVFSILSNSVVVNAFNIKDASLMSDSDVDKGIQEEVSKFRNRNSKFRISSEPMNTKLLYTNIAKINAILDEFEGIGDFIKENDLSLEILGEDKGEDFGNINVNGSKITMNTFKYSNEKNYINFIRSKVRSRDYPGIKDNFKDLSSYHISWALGYYFFINIDDFGYIYKSILNCAKKYTNGDYVDEFISIQSDGKSDEWLADVFASLCLGNDGPLEKAMRDYLNYKSYLKKSIFKGELERFCSNGHNFVIDVERSIKENHPYFLRTCLFKFNEIFDKYPNVVNFIRENNKTVTLKIYKSGGQDVYAAHSDENYTINLDHSYYENKNDIVLRCDLQAFWGVIVYQVILANEEKNLGMSLPQNLIQQKINEKILEFSKKYAEEDSLRIFLLEKSTSKSKGIDARDFFIEIFRKEMFNCGECNTKVIGRGVKDYLDFINITGKSGRIVPIFKKSDFETGFKSNVQNFKRHDIALKNSLEQQILNFKNSGYRVENLDLVDMNLAYSNLARLRELLKRYPSMENFIKTYNVSYTFLADSLDGNAIMDFWHTFYWSQSNGSLNYSGIEYRMRININCFQNEQDFTKGATYSDKSKFHPKLATEKIDNLINSKTYSVDHEFGHQIYFTILFCHQMLPGDRARNAAIIKNRILEFAKLYRTYDGDFVSYYGQTNDLEWFAELFASLQYGNKGALEHGMKDYLDSIGFGEDMQGPFVNQGAYELLKPSATPSSTPKTPKILKPGMLRASDGFAGLDALAKSLSKKIPDVKSLETPKSPLRSSALARKFLSKHYS